VHNQKKKRLIFVRNVRHDDVSRTRKRRCVTRSCTDALTSPSWTGAVSYGRKCLLHDLAIATEGLLAQAHHINNDVVVMDDDVHLQLFCATMEAVFLYGFQGMLCFMGSALGWANADPSSNATHRHPRGLLQLPVRLRPLNKGPAHVLPRRRCGCHVGLGHPKDQDCQRARTSLCQVCAD